MAIDLPPYGDELRVDVIPARAEVIVVPAGEIDVHTVPRVAGAVQDLRASGFDRVVIDLRRVGFIDSSGLGMLLGLREDAKRDGHLLELIAGPDSVHRVFELTATTPLFAWRSAP